MKNTIIALVAFLATSAYAEVINLDFDQTNKRSKALMSLEDQEYFTIKNVKVESIDEAKEFDDLFFTADGLEKVDNYLHKVIKVTDTLIALGDKVWTLIENNKPVVNTNFIDPISVIPNVGDDTAVFNEIYGWSAPRSQKYAISYENGFGIEVIRFEFSVNFQYDGQYNGTGRYLTGVTIVPNNIEVAWGYTFDAKSALVNITNRGSKLNPVAGATVELQYNVSTAIKDIRVKHQFHVAGNGEIIQMN